ncbi:MAG: uracil-DNA glycosylase [Dehalobacter sp. 4CP]|uniref:uracil-DNA glycosylase n=1 Tax=Dehalobacter sp. CP TaxID=2594474 RepID=UPI0013C78612|nr:uracil-DNA glycosylase [Dehalobacter sp. 4CP]
MQILKNDWHDLLHAEFDKEYYQKLRKFLIDEYRSRIVFPDKFDIYNALHYTAYRDVKVVILGQDPYHGPQQAHGLSFSVQPGVQAPPSLMNIFKELHDDLGCYVPNNGYLKKWADQGVLLLNASLTVRSGQANSHSSIGWARFTDKIIELLNEREDPVVFILWGKNAQSKLSILNPSRHCIIKSVHPSPLSAHAGFFGSRPFSSANQFLVSIGKKPIDWQIENLPASSTTLAGSHRP